MTYQTVTGTLNPGAHPGSYNGQDVYSDLLITEEINALQNDRLLRGGETSQTLDGSYFKGPGARNGKERELISMQESTEPTYMSDRKGHNGVTTDGTATTLTSQDKERPMVGYDDYPDIPLDSPQRVGQSIVRRLTPTECALLQGFPADWLDIGEWVDENGKKHKDSDTPKYKAAGNSIARPFWTWLTRRIAAQYEGRPPTIGSLFDGIGGFPLCWAQVNGPASVRWASEIEQFPIAVTKQHFGDEDAGVDGDIHAYL